MNAKSADTETRAATKQMDIEECIAHAKARVHLARGKREGDDWIVVLRPACGVSPTAVDTYWTLDPDLVTCYKCKQRG